MTENELIRPISTTNAQLPAYMQDDGNLGIEELGKFTRPPRLKIVQPLSKPPLIDLFQAGDVVIVPQNVGVAVHTGESRRAMTPPLFHFTPILFFPEWIAFNPRDVAGLNVVRERSLDEKSAIAARCRDSRRWEEVCPEAPDKKIRYTEVMNFIFIVHDSEAVVGQPVLVGFSRAEHKTGSNFASLLKMQRAPIFSKVWRATTSRRDNDKGQWYGLDITPPETVAWVPDSIYPTLKELHLEAKEALDAQLIDVDYESDPDNVVDAEVVSGDSPF